ncbi:MAG: carbon storage regulator [Rubripirellula sp.]
MLVLSRKQGESIEFPELNVVVRVMQLKKSKVQLGIEAPRTIKVDRSEMVTKTGADESTLPDEGSQKSPVESPCEVDGEAGNDDAQLFAQRLIDDLLKLEAEVAAMAELVSSKDRGLARQVAAVSIERLAALRRAVRLAERRGQARPIADFIKARGELLEQNAGSNRVEDVHPVKEWEEATPADAKCVRQPPAGYVAEPSLRAACHVA